ncbi:uncharacterized protein ABDE67_006680 [Symphorus nematophorus]
MSERHRALPAWMAKKEQKVKEKEPLKSRRKKKTARAAFYCMNEKELVEAAVSYLSNAACEDVVLKTDRKVEHKAADTAVEMKEDAAASKTAVKPGTDALEEESTDCGDAEEEMTYVSETDLDITEVETLPYTRSPRRQDPEGPRSGLARDHSGVMNVGLEAEKKEEHSRMPADAAEEDDSLRLVREIFFT